MGTPSSLVSAFSYSQGFYVNGQSNTPELAPDSLVAGTE